MSRLIFLIGLILIGISSISGCVDLAQCPWPIGYGNGGQSSDRRLGEADASLRFWRTKQRDWERSERQLGAAQAHEDWLQGKSLRCLGSSEKCLVYWSVIDRLGRQEEHGWRRKEYEAGRTQKGIELRRLYGR